MIYVHNGMFDVFYVCFSKVIRHFIHVYHTLMVQLFIFYFVGRYTSSGSVLSSFTFILQEGIPAVDQFLVHFPLFCRKVYQQWISSQFIFLYFVGRYTSSGSVLSSFSFILQEGIPAVDQFLASFLHRWNGDDFRLCIFRLITYHRFCSFQSRQLFFTKVT